MNRRDAEIVAFAGLDPAPTNRARRCGARHISTNGDRPVTNGLLTVELKSDQLQIGDTSFQARNPAFIGIVDDQDTPGPTYASLALLKENMSQQSGGVNLAYDTAGQKFVPVNQSSARARFAVEVGIAALYTAMLYLRLTD